MWPKQDGFIKSQHIFFNNIGTNVNIIFLVDKILKLKIELSQQVNVLHKIYNWEFHNISTGQRTLRSPDS